MGDEDKDTFWDSVANFFESISLKLKLIFGTIVGVFGFIAVFLLRKNINNREILELELKKVREEVEIEKAQEEIDRNDDKILLLEKKIEKIKKEIKELEELESTNDVSEKELDDFFDDRGF